MPSCVTRPGTTQGDLPAGRGQSGRCSCPGSGSWPCRSSAPQAHSPPAPTPASGTPGSGSAPAATSGALWQRLQKRGSDVHARTCCPGSWPDPPGHRRPAQRHDGSRPGIRSTAKVGGYSPAPSVARPAAGYRAAGPYARCEPPQGPGRADRHSARPP
ncbi:hypothetical protein D3C80_1582310 [compost metagenome]